MKLTMSRADQIATIASNAGRIVEGYYQSKNYDVWTKSDPGDYVTTADIASEEYIRKQLKKLFPRDKIFSEENPRRPTDFSGRVWFVDPLDGTASFVAREKNFTVLIGACDDGTPMIGAVCAPLTGEVYYAEKDKGAWRIRNNKKQQVAASTIQDIADARMIINKKYQRIEPLLARIIERIPCKELKTDGDGMTGKILPLLARGSADCRIHPNFSLCKWDTCAGHMLIEEAGGKITNIDGKPLNYAQKAVTWNRSVVATNGWLHKELLRLIRRKTKRKAREK